MVMFVATFIDNVPLRDCQKKLDNIEALVKGTDAYNLGMIVCTPLCVSWKGFGSIASDEWSDSDSDFEKENDAKAVNKKEAVSVSCKGLETF